MCDKFAGAGFQANMITYLTKVLNLPMVKASNTLTNFAGTSGFTPILGALVADSFAGRYWTIIVGSIIYELGMISITLSALLPSLRPPPCSPSHCQEASSRQLWILYAALILTSLGTGGIRPCVGSPLYRKLKPGGSPFVRLAQVVVAAWRKRTAVAPAEHGELYRNKELDADISLNGRLLHTDQFRWLDRAAIIVATDATTKPNLWRIATVHRVEELKSILRMLPIWAAGILHFAASSHLQSFVILQAFSMNRHLSSTSTFQIPPASLSVVGVITTTSGLVLYDRLLVPLLRRVTGNPTGITCLQRMGVGFLINIVATAVSALVEVRRKEAAARHGLLDAPEAVIPISVFWLVPQYVLHGVADVFMTVGHVEFLYDQCPESMRSTAAALSSLTGSFGSYIGTGMVSLVHEYTGKEGNWLPDRNLNRGKLDCYYWLVTVVQVVNFVYYAVVAWFYVYKPVEEMVDDGNDVEGDGGGDVGGGRVHRSYSNNDTV
ncbi:unnamed protein product [Linum tenue]|uniref:Uncharacterized protein n=1 Tax=Linum tenue TaxID=586396 RepID=A0AAV0LZ46_9ROSI|nr:unnamed protein product [Linum tenue]